MSKLLALVAATTGVAAVTVGGVYLVRNSGTGSSAVKNTTQIRELTFKSVDDFESK